jgi:hypothetical protein
MEENAQLIQFEEILNPKIDINLIIEQARITHELLEKLGIEKATFISGQLYHNNSKTNTITLATNGLIAIKGENITTVVIKNPESTKEQALSELQKGPLITQEAAGAFSGKSQSWVSQILSNDDNEE